VAEDGKSIFGPFLSMKLRILICCEARSLGLQF